MWHRILALFGFSDKGERVPEVLSWAQFDRTMDKVCKDGKVRKKHLFEVNHLNGHSLSLVECMGIEWHKVHRKLPHGQPLG